MKVTKEQLKQIIKEELDTVIGESYYDNEMQRYYDDQIQKQIEKDKAEKQKSDEEEAGEKESGEVKEEEQAVTEEQYFEILVREDGFADAELLTKEEADDRLDPKTEFTHTYNSKGRYIAKVVRIADLER